MAVTKQLTPHLQREISKPANPPSNFWFLYPKTDGWYVLDDAGVETAIGNMLKSTYDPDLNGVVEKADTVLVEVRKGSVGTIAKGTPVYASGYNIAGWVEVEAAEADVSASMPALGLAYGSITNSATGYVIVSGLLNGIDTSSFSVGNALFVSETAGTLTATRPTGAATKIQAVCRVLRSHASLGAVIVQGAGRSNDQANLTDGKLWVGNSSNQGAEVSLSGDATMSNTGAVTVASASDTVAGKVELATAGETNTGTDTGRAVTPDGLAGSVHGEKVVQCIVFDFGTDVTTGDGKFYIVIPSTLNGMNLVGVHAKVITAGTTNTTDIQIANVTDTQDMLSTKLTIDSTETGSDTAATAAVINTSYDDVATNDLLRIDVDAVSTTAPKGLIVTLIFRLP